MAQILTEAIFINYGGKTGTVGQVATVGQVLAAFEVAEYQVAQELGTYAIATRVTGSMRWPTLAQPVVLEFGQVRSIDGVTLYYEGSPTGCLAGYGFVLDSQAGVVQVFPTGTVSSVWDKSAYPGLYQPSRMDIAYTAGYNSGTLSNDASVLLALTTAADLILQQIIDPAAAEGGPGNPGVQSWSSLRYSERRTPLRQTAFGSSARANFAADLLHRLKVARIGRV